MKCFIQVSYNSILLNMSNMYNTFLFFQKLTQKIESIHTYSKRRGPRGHRGPASKRPNNEIHSYAKSPSSGTSENEENDQTVTQEEVNSMIEILVNCIFFVGSVKVAFLYLLDIHHSNSILENIYYMS